MDLQTLLLVTYGAGVGSFLLGFILCVIRVKDELVVISRLLWWARFAVVPLFVSLGVLLYFEVETRGAKHRFIWPSYGVIRPVLGLTLSPLAAFLVSHPIFRWTTVVIMLALTCFDSLTLAELEIQIDCKEDLTCQSSTGWQLQDLQILWWRSLVAIGLQLWLTLLAAYLLIAQGACHSRYHPRLFSSSHPLPVIPGREGFSAKAQVGIPGRRPARKRRPHSTVTSDPPSIGTRPAAGSPKGGFAKLPVVPATSSPGGAGVGQTSPRAVDYE